MKKPKPTEVVQEGVDIPSYIRNPELYMQGFQHGLTSNTLSVKQMKTSFRMGFRAAKIYLREQGIVSRQKEIQFKVKSKWV